MAKRIKLMAEYSSYPLWSLDASSSGPINPADLPLTKETLFLLQSWSDKYESRLNIHDPAKSNFFSQDERLEFEKEGVRLWLRLREELSPDFEIEYFSEITRKSLKDPSELKSKDDLFKWDDQQ